MTEYEIAIIKENLGRFEDLVFDADALLDNCSDPGLHGMILGIKAVAQSGASSLAALLSPSQST